MVYKFAFKSSVARIELILFPPSSTCMHFRRATLGYRSLSSPARENARREMQMEEELHVQYSAKT